MTDFNDMWGFPSDVQKTIPSAKCYVEENTGRTYRSGRPVVDVVFIDANRREICRRSGMRLKSKKGNDYVVCRREPEPSAPHRAVAAVAEQQHYSSSDVFDE